MMASRVKRQGDKGFTIVELLIVVVVIAILASVTVVSYNGIQDRARQSVNLAAIDQYEKAVGLYRVENGDAPQAFTQEYLNGMYDDTNKYLAAQKAVTDSILLGSPMPTEPPIYLDKRPGCVPGDYPAKGVFEQGECSVIMSIVDFNDPGIPTITERLSYVEVDDFDSKLAPKYLSHLPTLKLDDFTISISLNNTSYNFYLPGNTSNSPDATKYVSLTQVQAYRGVLYSKNASTAGDVAAWFTYYAQGDQSCGRGKKTLHTPAATGSAYRQAIENFNATNNATPGYIPTQVEYSSTGGDTWTQCQTIVHR